MDKFLHKFGLDTKTLWNHIDFYNRLSVSVTVSKGWGQDIKQVWLINKDSLELQLLSQYLTLSSDCIFKGIEQLLRQERQDIDNLENYCMDFHSNGFQILFGSQEEMDNSANKLNSP